MGCATSSPLVSAHDGFLKATKGTVDTLKHTGEDTMHDMTGAFGTAVGNVKEAVVGAVHNVGHGVENALHYSKTETDELANETENVKKSLKSLNESNTIDAINKNSNNIENSVGDIEKMIIDEKQNLKQTANDMLNQDIDLVKNSIDNEINETVNNIIGDESPMHSIDSLKTSTPEPEIENALANDKNDSPPTPKPTYSELEKLQSDLMESSTEAELMKEIIKEVERIQKIPESPTDWEKMADTMSKPQKVNTVDSLRRILNEKRIVNSATGFRQNVRGMYIPPNIDENVDFNNPYPSTTCNSPYNGLSKSTSSSASLHSLRVSSSNKQNTNKNNNSRTPLPIRANLMSRNELQTQKQCARCSVCSVKNPKMLR